MNGRAKSSSKGLRKTLLRLKSNTAVSSEPWSVYRIPSKILDAISTPRAINSQLFKICLRFIVSVVIKVEFIPLKFMISQYFTVKAHSKI